MIDKNDSFWCRWNSDPFCEKKKAGTHCLGNDCPEKELKCAKCDGVGKMVVDGYKPPDCKRFVTCPYCDGKGFLVVDKQ